MLLLDAYAAIAETTRQDNSLQLSPIASWLPYVTGRHNIHVIMGMRNQVLKSSYSTPLKCHRALPNDPIQIGKGKNNDVGIGHNSR